MDRYRSRQPFAGSKATRRVARLTNASRCRKLLLLRCRGTSTRSLNESGSAGADLDADARIRILSASIGLLCTLMASTVGALGSIMEIAVRDSFAGPLLAVFLLGMLTTRTGADQVLIGAIAGLAATCAVNFLSPISFVWFPAVGCLATIAVAWLVNPFFGAAAKEVSDCDASKC